MLELSCYLNIALFSLSVSYTLDQKVEVHSTFAYISGSVMFVSLLIVLAYHVFTEFCLKLTNKLRQRRRHDSDRVDLINYPPSLARQAYPQYYEKSGKAWSIW